MSTAIAGRLRRAVTGRAVIVALEGRTDGAAPDRGAKHVTPYLTAGLTWWIEALGWWRGGPLDAMTRIRQGPPALTRH